MSPGEFRAHLGRGAPRLIPDAKAMEHAVDPDATLAALRAATHDYLAACVDPPDPEEMADAAEAAIAAMIALDSWLSMGGFPPTPWRVKRNGHREQSEPPATEPEVTTDPEGGD
jgi:hypothetical protein